ncbi:MAG: hypothetical protein ROO73_05985 [Roseivirga sp.]
MKKILVAILVLSPLSALTSEQDTLLQKVPVLVSKVSTLVFPQEIIDVEMASANYHLKVKGRYLLLRAKSSTVSPSSIFVRYGKDKTAYVAEIFPQEDAPLQLFIKALHAPTTAEKTQQVVAPEPIFSPYLPQHFFDCGTQGQGLRIILTHLMHTREATWIQLFVENRSSIDLVLETPTFEYHSWLRTSFFRRTTKAKPVEPLWAPSSFAIAHQQSAYVVFALPLYTATGGLMITFWETQGERTLQLFITARLLLNAGNTSSYG